MKNKKSILVLLIYMLIGANSFSQTSFYNLNTIQQIEIRFLQPNWDYQMDTAKYGADSYIIAEWVKINGVQFNTVGVKYKGSSSYDSTFKKNPLHIELDHVVSQSYEGIKDIKLSNGYADPSMIREVLSYHILNKYMISPRANFAKVFINDAYMGLYSNTESIGKTFCNNNFGISNQPFFKCSPQSVPSPVNKSNLRYISADSSAYFNLYEIKSASGWNDLVDLCNKVTNQTAVAHQAIDIDKVIWMLAFNIALVNLDSYSGVFAQNYYLYKDASGRFNPIIWDLNMSFGGFPFAGSSNSSMGSLNITEMQNLPPTLHSTDQFWPLIRLVMNNASYRKMFYAHLRSIINENFANGNYLTMASTFQMLIDAAVEQDANKFFTYQQFQNGLTANATLSNYTIPGISTLMTARTSYLQAHASFAAQGPVISNVAPSVTQPMLNATVTMRATVSNATDVFLAYRKLNYGPYIQLRMYDDGLHDDGQANDQVYGVQFIVEVLNTSYYIYAENATAASFFPQRAEKESLFLVATVPAPLPGDVAVNEFLAKNNSQQLNEYGEYADWIELINNTNFPINLYGLYMTDNPNNLTKWAFPQSAIIPANGLLIIWADERADTPGKIHCSFKLSADGESVIISNASGVIIDGFTFGPQTGDVSMGRCPDGTGPFVFLTPPKFNILNCPTALPLQPEKSQPIKVYPVPAIDFVSLSIPQSFEINKFTIVNNIGQMLKTGNYVDEKILVSELKPGVYVILLFDRYGLKHSIRFIKSD